MRKVIVSTQQKLTLDVVRNMGSDLIGKVVGCYGGPHTSDREGDELGIRRGRTNMVICGTIEEVEGKRVITDSGAIPVDSDYWLVTCVMET